MMNLPHLTFLRSFEASARHLSFTTAAEELNCTSSAVSNHVRSLESFLGRPLFVRHSRSLELTDLGEAYLPSVRQALLQIDMATKSVLSKSSRQTVAISCPMTLAEQWLAPVLAGFGRENPGVRITVHGTVWHDVQADVSDLSIVLGHDDDPPANSHRLWSDRLTLVCAPGYQVDGETFCEAEQLEKASLIQILGRSEYWEDVALSLGLERLNNPSLMRTNASGMALEMACNGAGVAALPRSLALPYLREGRLREPISLNIVVPWAYYLSIREGVKSSAATALFDWLQKEALLMQEETSGTSPL